MWPGFFRGCSWKSLVLVARNHRCRFRRIISAVGGSNPAGRHRYVCCSGRFFRVHLAPSGGNSGRPRFWSGQASAVSAVAGFATSRPRKHTPRAACRESEDDCECRRWGGQQAPLRRSHDLAVCWADVQSDRPRAIDAVHCRPRFWNE